VRQGKFAGARPGLTRAVSNSPDLNDAIRTKTIVRKSGLREQACAKTIRTIQATNDFKTKRDLTKNDSIDQNQVAARETILSWRSIGGDA
jgi:hypothetical protein